MSGHRLRRLIGVISLASGVLLGARPVFAISLSSNQPVVRHNVSPGQVVQGTIDLSNAGDEPLQVRIYLEDWRYTDEGDGSKEFAPPATLPRSAAGWIRFQPQQVEIPAHGKTVVDYTITVPENSDLDGGYYAVLFFESLILGPSDTGESEALVKYAARLGSLFMLEIAKTTRHEAALQSIKIDAPTASSPMRVQAVLANTGNVSLKCEGTFHVMNANQVVAARGELPTKYVWPGHQTPVTAEWAGELGQGTYSVVLTYDCGDELVLVEEVPTSVP